MLFLVFVAEDMGNGRDRLLDPQPRQRVGELSVWSRVKL